MSDPTPLVDQVLLAPKSNAGKTAKVKLTDCGSCLPRRAEGGGER
jgi:hypothetical protein